MFFFYCIDFAGSEYLKHLGNVGSILSSVIKTWDTHLFLIIFENIYTHSHWHLHPRISYMRELEENQGHRVFLLILASRQHFHSDRYVVRQRETKEDVEN